MSWWPFFFLSFLSPPKGDSRNVPGVVVYDRRLLLWREAVKRCGLSLVEVSHRWTSPRLTARAGPVEVRLERRRSVVQVTVWVQGPPDFASVRIRREASMPPGEREVVTGDEAFDSTFVVEGPPRFLVARLDTEMRRLLREANAVSELEITGGTLRTETRDYELAQVLPLLVEIGRRWAKPLDVMQCLAENAQQDFEAGVRLSNLLLLVRGLPGDPRAAAALRTACTDASPQVRLRAAMELGAEGRDVLLKLAESMGNDDVSSRAVAALGRELPLERARAILNRALRGHHVQTARACLEVIGRSGAATAIDTLARVLARENDEMAVAAAVALGSTGDAAAEPPLILALRSSMDWGVLIAVATALGRVGSAAAVLPLKEAAERAPRDDEVRRAIRQAIAEIQSRLQGASPGQLSLAAADTGQLSLATDPAGQLSLPPDEPGPG